MSVRLIAIHSLSSRYMYDGEKSLKVKKKKFNLELLKKAE